MKVLVTALSIVFLVGCGTISERIVQAGKPPTRLYEGTAFDAAMIASPFWKCHGPSCGLFADLLIIEVPACIIGVVSMPISLTVDTLMIPVDMYKIKSREPRI